MRVYHNIPALFTYNSLNATNNQLQKSILQIERKMEKDQKDSRAELKDLLERVAERIDKRLQEAG